MIYLSLPLAIAIFLSGLGLASLFRKYLKLKGEPSLLVDTALGTGGLSIFIFIFGILQLFSGTGKIIMLIHCAVFAFLGLKRVSRETIAWFKQPKEPKSPLQIVGYWLPVLLLLLIGYVTLVAGSAPAAMDDWDSLAYHLTAPKLYIEHGGLYYINFSSHTNFPMLVEMLYIPALMLKCQVGAKLVHFVFGILMVLAVIRLAEKHTSKGSGYLAGIIAAGVPIVLWEATTAYIDLATALYTVLAADALLDMYDKKKYNTALVSGLCVGFAASTKLLGAAIALFAGFWLIYIAYYQNRKEFGKLVGWFILGAIICLPWYVRSFVYTGSPVYPFYYSIFGGRDWNQTLANAYSASQAHFGMGHTLIDLILVPYNLLVHSEKFYDTPGLYVGPILLVGIPMMLLMLKYRSKKMQGLAVFILVQILLWFVLTQQSRYLIPVYALLAALVAGLAYSSESLRSLKVSLWIIFAATAFFAIYTIIPFYISRYPVAFGGESSEDYLKKSVDTYSATQFINQNMPSDAKVALFGDTRGLYLNREFAWADWGHNTIFSRDFTNVDELIQYLHRSGFTHALVNLQFLSTEHNGPLVAEAILQGRFIREYPSIDIGAKVSVFEIAK